MQRNMLDTQLENRRTQTAMIVYELEQALGRYVLENERDPSRLPEGTVNDIQKREKERGRTVDVGNVRNIVEATYFDEVFGLALHTANGTSDKQLLLELQKKCIFLDLYKIRNAVSHPNRSFPECYWFRAATIATDPLIQQLRLHSVHSKFRAAEKGKIHPPPEDWVRQSRWSLPNNLPNTFDHSITGLIGRDNEVKKATNALKNPRVPITAIVAPGGLGKTALLLEVLEKVSLDPESANWIDEILYLSFKTEFLRYKGIEKIDESPEATINGLKSSITQEISSRHENLDIRDFKDVLSEYKDKKLLLCLDNLETFLRESPEEFRDFHLELPPTWRVIVTSRVSVGMAMTISLKPLDEKGARALAYKYLASRGKSISQPEMIQRLIDHCQNNPLAIRLTLDSYLAGNPLLDAASSVREEILKFSFKNLIETLSENSVSILECLFAIGEPAKRAELCMLLDLNRDQVAESFDELMRTSLVTRLPARNEERATLSSSVRELLLLNPMDPDIRQKVKKKVAARKAFLTSQSVEQQRRDKTPLDWDFIPKDSPAHAKQLAIKVHNALRKRDRVQVRKLVPEVKSAAEADPEEPLIRRVLGQLLIELGDHTRGNQNLFDAASKLKPRDPAAAFELAKRLLESQDLNEANQLSEWLIQENWANVETSSLEHVQEIYRVYWLSLMWLGKFEQVIEGTKNWQQRKDLTNVFGSIYVSALRRSVERETLQVAAPSLEKAVDALETLLEIEGVTGVSANEGLKLIDDIVRNTEYWTEFPPPLAYKTCRLVDGHMRSMIRVHRDYTQEHERITYWVTTLKDLNCGEHDNPLDQEAWERFLTDGVYAKDKEYKLLGEGYKIVTVYNRPSTSLFYLFARDEDGNEYYVHKDCFINDDASWTKLRTGDRLAITKGIVLDRDKATPAREAKMV